MNLSQATSKELIFLNQPFVSKEEIFDFIAQKFAEQGVVASAADYKAALYDRENMGITGFENGLAIPHGKSSTVKKAAFAVIRLTQALVAAEYPSLNPSNQVDTLFVLAIPETEAATHLDLLAQLAGKLGDEAYLAKIKSAKTPDEMLQLLAESEENTRPAAKTDKGLILAITACAAGIAHTYMAAEAIAKKAAELGYRAKVEKQGANGLEDRITAADVNQAIGIIYAHDVALKETDRFAKLPKVDVAVAEPIRDAEKVINSLLEKSKNYVPSTDDNQDVISDVKKTFWQEVKDSVLTGISYMIPIIIAGAMISAFALAVTQIFGLSHAMAAPVAPAVNTFWLFTLKTLGGNMLSVLMTPVLSAYMAYSIADKPGLAPGFAAGLAANAITSGFLGGMLGGLIAGFLMKWMKEHIHPKGALRPLVTFWVYPVVGTLITAILMLFVIGQPVAWINTSLLNFLKSMQGANAMLLGAIIGAMVSFDLGGPVNKASWAFCVGVMASGNLVPYAAFAACKMVSAFSLSIAMLLRRNWWTVNEKEIGMQTWILGFAGITEGAIPVAMGDPIRILGSFIAGSAVTGALTMAGGVGLGVPGAGIFSLAFLKSSGGTLSGDMIWIGATLVGTAVSVALLLITRGAKVRKNILVA